VYAYITVMTFAEQLREASRGLTQVEVEKRSGIDQSTISRYLDGLFEPSYSNLIALERALPKLRQIRMRDVA